MHPILFEVGGIAIHSYGVLSAVGFLVIAFLTIRRARARGMDPDKVVDMIFWTSIAGVVGARAVYIIQNPGDMQGLGDVINLRKGGLVFYGALLTILPVGGLLMRKHKLPFYELMDVIATAAPLGHAIARLGCLCAGCCHGSPTDLPWAITFDHPQAATDPAFQGLPLHPTQLYEVAYLLGIFGVVNLFYPRRRFPGQVALLYLVLYATFRSINELFRGDLTRGHFLEGVLGQTLSTSQGLSILLVIGALAVFVLGARRSRKQS